MLSKTGHVTGTISEPNLTTVSLSHDPQAFSYTSIDQHINHSRKYIHKAISNRRCMPFISQTILLHCHIAFVIILVIGCNKNVANILLKIHTLGHIQK